MSFWSGRRVLVTGGFGFVGSHVVTELLASGANVSVADNLSRPSVEFNRLVLPHVTEADGDLRSPDFCTQCIRGQDSVLHLAAKVAGIGYNSTHNADMLSENVLINSNVIDGCYRNGIDHVFVTSSPVCILTTLQCLLPNLTV
jgi:GDP-L-fucose synthase